MSGPFRSGRPRICARIAAVLAALVALASGQLPAIAGPAAAAAAAAGPGIVFSNPVVADGIAAWPGDPDKNPDHAASSRLGVPCWQTSPELRNQYVYLNIDSARIPAGATDAVLTVSYFDAPGQQLTAQYDSVSAAFTPLRGSSSRAPAAGRPRSSGCRTSTSRTGPTARTSG